MTTLPPFDAMPTPATASQTPKNCGQRLGNLPFRVQERNCNAARTSRPTWGASQLFGRLDCVIDCPGGPFVRVRQSKLSTYGPNPKQPEHQFQPSVNVCDHLRTRSG